MMGCVFAFLHHLAAFTLAAALACEFILMRSQWTLDNARNLQRADLVYGVSAGLVLIIGALRVVYFEKGLDYYLQSLPFIIKLVLFVTVGLLSILPTLEFISWNTTLRQDQLPNLDRRKMQRIRGIIHLELAGIVLILLMASLMARGIGMLGYMP